LERAKDISTAVVAPIQRGLTVVARPVGDFFSSLAEIASLRSENARLKEQLDEYRAQVNRAQDLESQNEELRRVLRLGKSWQTMKTVTAQVIGDAPSNYKWAVFIDKGKADGIRRDMAVISPDGLVGKVARAEAHYSTVILLIDPGAHAGARVEPSKTASFGASDGIIGTGARQAPKRGWTGSVSGGGEGNLLSLDFISNQANVKVGDKVVTWGYDGGIFPPGIPIGTVASVGTDARTVDEQIKVQPSVDFGGLQFVQVLLETGKKVKVAGSP
jgi:rod shape-determining protein MreC